MSGEKQETLSDICEEMRGHARDGNFVNGYEVGSLANRIEAAAKRLAIPTPEQWTEFARQGSELERFKGLYQDALNDNEQMRSYDDRLEADFDALMKDRNSLAERNRECCDENADLKARLRAIKSMLDRDGFITDDDVFVNWFDCIGESEVAK